MAEKVRSWIDAAGLEEPEGDFVQAAARMLAGRGRGLFLMGARGSGKTTLMELLAKKLDFPAKASTELIDEAVELRKKKGERTGLLMAVNSAPIDYAERWSYDLCIDDLGKEPQEQVAFGNRDSIIARVIEQRYNDWRRHGWLTHFTTELFPEQLAKAYPVHIVERIKEMTLPAMLVGNRRAGW